MKYVAYIWKHINIHKHTCTHIKHMNENNKTKYLRMNLGMCVTYNKKILKITPKGQKNTNMPNGNKLIVLNEKAHLYTDIKISKENCVHNVNPVFFFFF